jgi:hypothetical protein
MAEGRTDDAKQEVEAALKLEPANRSAQELRRQIAVKGGLKR